MPNLFFVPSEHIEKIEYKAKATLSNDGLVSKKKKQILLLKIKKFRAKREAKLKKNQKKNFLQKNPWTFFF